MKRSRGQRATLYELMRGAGQSGSQASADESAPGVEAARFTGAARAEAPGWRAPWRVPPGLLAAGLAGALLAVVLAFAIGYAQGRKAGERAVRAEQDRGGMPATWGPEPAEAGAGKPAPEEEREDPREPGLNYLILARYDRAEAERLVAFLEKHGVEAFTRKVNDRGIYHVISRRGFTAEERKGDEYRHHVRWIKQLGRIWKAQHEGPSDLADMWELKYKP